MSTKIESCLVCGEELEYFEVGREMECVFCHNKFISKSVCRNGHYVCDRCHSEKAVSDIVNLCMKSKSVNPIS